MQDIIDNITRIETYLEGVDKDALVFDQLRYDAIERCLERVCEATVRLGDQALLLMPGQPWLDIRGMGNRLRHAYDSINFEVIWKVVSDRLPSLKGRCSGSAGEMARAESLTAWGSVGAA